MRTFAILVVLAFLLAEGVALLPGPCCLNSLLRHPGEDPFPCSHGSESGAEGCCQPAEPVASSCCCGKTEAPDQAPAMNGSPASCRCRHHEAPDSDKSVGSDVEPTGLQPAGVVSTPHIEIPDTPDPEGSGIRVGTGPPGPSLTLTLRVLLL